ncbi:small lysine-rich protein 1 isoform X2 [Pleurodeles waltl]|uniref:small lysine-rich protein 1 isoform X2 n=1 Tax=Pleurodeles waltl TaxID=8319 RepID=UPI003709706F
MLLVHPFLFPTPAPQPVKGAKRSSKSRSSSKSQGKVKGKGKGKKAKKTKAPAAEVDILSPAAMLNAYYISHNAADCLTFRGFGWAGAPKKKGKGKKGKKK